LTVIISRREAQSWFKFLGSKVMFPSLQMDVTFFLLQSLQIV
jgi:hypothetical protein